MGNPINFYQLKKAQMIRYTKINKLASLVAVSAMVFMSSCVKNAGYTTDFGGLKPIVQIVGSGLGKFTDAAINFPATDARDTLQFTVNFASVDLPSKDVTISLDYDDAALTTYNASSAIKYAKFPDSTYSYTTKSVTIKAGSNYSAPVNFIVFPNKIDPTQNYMFPISIKDAQGNTISGNFGTMYYHAIGNPIAGNYVWDFQRWNNPAGTGSLSGLSFTGGSAVFSPVTPTKVTVPSGYYIQPRYEITFTNTGGILTNFAVKLNDDDVAAMANNGVTVTNGPNILKADPINKIYKFQYTTVTRYIIDTYHN
jgi:Domain of unknown function (DUF1735)